MSFVKYMRFIQLYTHTVACARAHAFVDSFFFFFVFSFVHSPFASSLVSFSSLYRTHIKLIFNRKCARFLTRSLFSLLSRSINCNTAWRYSSSERAVTFLQQIAIEGSKPLAYMYRYVDNAYIYIYIQYVRCLCADEATI